MADDIKQDQLQDPRLEATAPPRLADYWKIIPRQIPLYWMEGRFNITQYRSDRYNTLGWSLLVRGVYWYEATKGSSFRHAGIAEIDFDRDAETLNIKGVRLLDLTETKHEVVLWQSMLFKLDGRTDAAKLQFAYKWMRIPEHWRTDDTKIVNQLAAEATKRFQYTRPLSSLESLSEAERTTAYKWISENFDDCFGRLLIEKIKDEYALVICESIEAPDADRFEFDGQYLPTNSVSDDDKIKFLRLL